MYNETTMPEVPAAARHNGSSGGEAATGGKPLSQEWHNFLADIEQLVGNSSLLNGEDLEKLRAKVGAGVARARESIDTVGSTIDRGARKTATVADDYVHQQPWNAVGVGAVVGFLLGFMVARRD